MKQSNLPDFICSVNAVHHTGLDPNLKTLQYFCTSWMVDGCVIWDGSCFPAIIWCTVCIISSGWNIRQISNSYAFTKWSADTNAWKITLWKRYSRLEIGRGTGIEILHLHKSGFLHCYWIVGGENGSCPNLRLAFKSINKKSERQTRCKTPNKMRYVSHSTTQKRLMKIHIRRWNAGESGIVSQISSSLFPTAAFSTGRQSVVDTVDGCRFSTRDVHFFNDLFTSNYIHMSEEGMFLIKGNQQSGRVCTFIHIQRSTASSPRVRKMRFRPITLRSTSWWTSTNVICDKLLFSQSGMIIISRR